MPERCGIVLASTVLLLAAGPVDAHSLHVEAKLRGNTVKVEVFYSDNTPARDATVSVRDPGGKEIAVGRTDDQGEWTFPRPPAGKYKIVADTGAGHQAHATITIPSEAVLKTLSPAPEEVIVTSGPSREELTRFPWLRAAIGVAAIRVWLCCCG